MDTSTNEGFGALLNSSSSSTKGKALARKRDRYSMHPKTRAHTSQNKGAHIPRQRRHSVQQSTYPYKQPQSSAAGKLRHCNISALARKRDRYNQI